MRKYKEPTITSIVLEALRNCDDFLNYRMLMQRTGYSYTRVSAACFQLRYYRCIDVVINADGVAWWFALPRESDTRQRVCKERTPESKPRRPHKRNAPRKKGGLGSSLNALVLSLE